ncbi:MAG: ATP-dependent Clp protease proteolytic subunit [Chitinispirillales bacterium]|jgi:membrane-bound serine protease (ClpP class)|nr:ATP-dependent Clp protease proteolytic subunit [Chitinispirillales bacterium]
MIKKFYFAIIPLLAAIFLFADDTASVTISDPGPNPVTAATTTKVNANIRKAFVIPVSGPVDHGLAAFVGRAVKEAGDQDNSIVILDIDTFGGQVDAAFAIVEYITGSALPTIAFVRSKAISAGALIALAADQMAMRPSTTIGDVAPLINTSEGPKMLGEKHQSPIRAKFRTLAHKNGFSEILSEAMVTEGPGVFEVTLPDTVLYLDSVKIAELDPQTKSQIRSTRQIVRPGELLTMTEVEALQYGFSKMTVSTIDEMLREMGYVNAEIISVGRNWSERFVSIIAMLAPVLMMIGFSALYIEMRSPGFGIPGAIGIACLALVFFGQYMVGLAHYTEMLLLVTGAVLLAIEIFVLPGFGVAGISGIILMMIGMVLSFQNFVIPSPEFPWQAAILKQNIIRLCLSIIGSFVLIIIFFKYFFVRLSRVVKGPYLAATLGDAQSDEGMNFVPKVGDKGVASTSLRPSGKVSINKNTCDVVTDGLFIDSGTAVEVVQIQGNRIVVVKI